MTLNTVLSGKNIPEDIYVIIEISAHSNPIKYEVNKDLGLLFVDRFIPVPMFYPCNYGFINKTKSNDGDPLDVLVHTPYPILPGSIIRCKPIGVLNMFDESGEDYKIIAIPHPKVCLEYSSINDICHLSPTLKQQIIHFFKHYKNLENNKWVKIIGWENKKNAEKIILSACEKFHK
ncbi:inorganic pyrophosphatase [Buchnera aphidicola str. Bp (Baizongia pistaciae)]|uniref:Inorganic pyrophosphatase n=1 Tax=Buchnera aphidicola subsp. Baizongia pistaciae (strain Bp) TaxID=224915 RepID=IPYR_BUCBP|nr:inorganic diphosphatase [Buchnera aphidicola]P59417.1 RecName: Full=Inorganic pyrophosphatase; AltName: Full=Pyrophosphate phospho-hydrolase; Short=PPase [Buchnera aphidicola str. Bp (Baizongia pistaciae)]AAO26818.1 inorganic pyrophosphatase [Buchnera aphidicola str. Bp (Baizongia pistaciae)]